MEAMRKLLSLCRDFGFAVLAVVASMFALDWVAGVPNGPFLAGVRTGL